MKQFEYTIVEAPAKGMWGMATDFEALVQTLNEMGKKGWEVVSANDMLKGNGTTRPVIILKREISH